MGAIPFMVGSGHGSKAPFRACVLSIEMVESLHRKCLTFKRVDILGEVRETFSHACIEHVRANLSSLAQAYAGAVIALTFSRINSRSV
jgi:hypothetical protein